MADTLHLEIVTAGGAAVDTQAQQVTLPLADGEAGVLPGHAPLLGALVSGVVRYTSGGAEHYCAVSPGTVNVAANTVTVLARTAEPAPDIDLPRAEAALRRAVEGRCEILEGSQDKSVYATLKLHVGRDEEVRAVIAAVNDAVELRSFQEIIPSMNDIFIRAVSGNL